MARYRNFVHKVIIIDSNMKKQLNFILNKCKSLSRQVGRSSSYYSSKSNSLSREDQLSCWENIDQQKEWHETVFVGQTRRPYAISSKYLNHPLLNAVIEKESRSSRNGEVWVKCEVVLFDHLLWMLEDVESEVATDTLEELAEFYAM